MDMSRFGRSTGFAQGSTSEGSGAVGRSGAGVDRADSPQAVSSESPAISVSIGPAFFVQFGAQVITFPFGLDAGGFGPVGLGPDLGGALGGFGNGRRALCLGLCIADSVALPVSVAPGSGKRQRARQCGDPPDHLGDPFMCRHATNATAAKTSSIMGSTDISRSRMLVPFSEGVTTWLTSATTPAPPIT